MIFREKITNETYIYLEELTKLKGFNFFPKYAIDIEKPASVSQEYPFIWMQRLNESSSENDYIVKADLLKNKKKSKEENSKEYPKFIRTKVKFDFHLRY